MTGTPQQYHQSMVHYFRRRIDFGDTPTHSIRRFYMGTLPSGSQILYTMGTVKTAFSAAGTRVLSAGTNGTTANNCLATITEETATAVMPLIGAKLTISSATDVFAKLTTTGTAAAAGYAEVVMAYVPPTAEGD